MTTRPEWAVQHGELIRQRLKELGWSQAYFALLLGTDPVNVRRWINGTRFPQEIKRMWEALQEGDGESERR